MAGDKEVVVGWGGGGWKLTPSNTKRVFHHFHARFRCFRRNNLEMDGSGAV